MPQDVYVWQRAWTPGVRRSVATRAAGFNCVIVLGAQVWWKNGQTHVARPEVDWDCLRGAGARVGVALRINEFAGGEGEHAEAGNFLANLAASMTDTARLAGVKLEELQLDFDAAESKLPQYARWVRAIRAKVAPVPVVITAIPSWLDAPGFRALAETAGEYVLQVHSFERPKSPERMTLCDVAAADRAVERAARFGVPFRVALPTYGYLVAFDPAGKFLGISAEGPAPAWPAGSVIRAVRADAAHIASLVSAWTADRPAAMRGVVWYRMPVDADSMNWRWPTLRAVMGGRPPRSELRVEQWREAQGVVTLELVNTGEADEPLDAAVVIRGAAIRAADGIGGFHAAGSGNEIRFRDDGDGVLGAGDRRTIGWVRCDGEVVAHVVR
jgi:hypothetical protein